MLKSGPAAKKGVTEGFKSHASRWMEKLKREKWIKPQNQTSHKMHDKPVPGKSSKGSSMAPGTSSKTITTGKRSMTKTIVEATTSTATSSKGKESALQKKAKRKVLRTSESLAVRFPGLQKVSSSEVSATSTVVTGNELVKEEELDVGQQSLTAPERLLEDREGNRYGDPQLRIRCYLEACVFIDDVARAQNYLLCHHRQLSKRTHLSISAYNTIMRMWAKKVCMRICIFFSTPY